MDNVSINTDSDTLRDKIRSCSTLNSLYHETRQEIELLNKQIFVKDNIIADLKARLGRYERIYMTVGDNESVVIGPSKSLLESLCKEICKLKQKRNDMEFKASRQAEVRHAESAFQKLDRAHECFVDSGAFKSVIDREISAGSGLSHVGTLPQVSWLLKKH